MMAGNVIRLIPVVVVYIPSRMYFIETFKMSNSRAKQRSIAARPRLEEAPGGPECHPETTPPTTFRESGLSFN